MKKRLSATSKCGDEDKEEVGIDWEVRPGGLLVQRRFVASPSSSSNSDGPMIKIKVSQDSYHHHLTLPAHSSFGKFILLLFFSLLFSVCIFSV